MNSNEPGTSTLPTSATKTVGQMVALSEVLLGVAYADGSYDDEERAAINLLIADYAEIDLEEAELPTEVVAHMLAFDPEAFDVYEAVLRLRLGGAPDARTVLRLVMHMVDADAARDTGEESYFFNLATALGLADEAFDIMLGLDDD